MCALLLLTAKKSGVPDTTLGKILRIVAVIANVPRHPSDGTRPFPSSVHRLKTQLSINPSKDQQVVYICPAMAASLQAGVPDKVQERCGQKVNPTEDPDIFWCESCELQWPKKELDRDGNFFCTVPLRDILTKTMSRLGRFVSTDEPPDAPKTEMNDVVDGLRYRKMNLSEEDLVIIAHSDGAAISKSTSKKLYLTYVQVVNIPLHIRMPIWSLQQVWVGEHLPKDRKCFLVEMTKQLTHVQTGNPGFEPIKWTDKNAKEIDSSAYVHSYLADSPERTAINGQLSHSAAQGCIYCLQVAECHDHRMCYM